MSLEVSAFTQEALTTGMRLDDSYIMYVSIHAEAWVTMPKQMPASCVAYCRMTETKQDRKVFFGGIPQSIGSKAFKKLMMELGAVQEVWLAMQPGQKTHRGFGFAVFKCLASIDAFLGGEDVQTKFARFRDGATVLDAKRATPTSPTSERC